MANTLINSGGAAAALVFESTTFEVVDQQGHQWLKSGQLAQALGYADETAITKLYSRRKDEFTNSMSQTVNLTVQGQMRETRIFSLRGAHLLAMFARTAIAALFRKWVLDILDKQTQATRPMLTYARISPAQAQSLKELVASVVAAGKQGYPDTWARLQKKFRVNSYLELGADQFEDACAYLTAKLPDAPDQPQTAINATDGPALKAARDVALRYFDDLRGAVKSGGGSASMGQIPADVLTGLVADALMRQRFLVTFDYCNGGMQVNPVPADAIVCSAAELPRLILQSDSPFSNDEVLAIARHANMRMMGAAGQIGKNDEVEQLRKTVRKLHPSYLLEIAQDAWMELGMRTALTNELARA